MKRKSAIGIALIVIVLLLSFLLASCGQTENESSKEATDFPTGDIRLIVMQAAGGGYDTQIRGFVPYFAKYLGANVFVDNIPGGGGTLAANTAWAAKPDGHNLLYAGIAARIMEQYLNPQNADYKMSEFIWIGEYCQEVMALYVRPDTPYYTWDDLVEASKEAPLKFGTGGITSPPYLEGVFLAEGTDLNFQYVHYDGSSGARAGMARKEVDVAIANYASVAKFAADGDARFICVLSERRQPHLDDVPTAIEAGMPEEQFYRYKDNPVLDSPRAIAVPPGTPEEVVDILRKAFIEAGNDPDFQEWIDKTKETWDPVEGEELQTKVRKMEQRFEEDDDLVNFLKKVLG